MDFKTLERVSIESLHDTFVKAFSDYQIKIDLPLWKFNNMLKRRGFSPTLSVGAFHEKGELLGFVLNGVRDWGEKTTVYDCGTGVIPEYRKQGITSNIFTKLLYLLKNNNIDHYLLEVIQSNKHAFELYRKQGFSITRNFACFKVDKDHVKKAPNRSAKFDFCDIELINWELFKSFWEYQPSWQNSIESVKAVSNSFRVITAQVNEVTVGYGIVDIKTGDVPQLAVHKNYRLQGIGHNILVNLLQHTESQNVSLINIDYTCLSILGFLQSINFENFVDQYEMILNV